MFKGLPGLNCRYCSDECQKILDPRKKPTKRLGARVNRYRDASENMPRNEEAIRQLALQWDQYVHPRGREFFVTQEKLIETLCVIGRSISQSDDPILVSHVSLYFPIPFRVVTTVFCGVGLYLKRLLNKRFWT